MTLFYSGVAGRRGYNPSGLIYHDDAGSVNATAAYYRAWLPTHQAESGFAHYYCCSDGTHQAEDEKNMAYHAANVIGNRDFIGIERCQSMGPLNVFLQNEETGFKLGAQILKRYGLPANRDTIKLHKQFSPTACPHRASEVHGILAQAVQDYFIAQTQKYMNNSGSNNAGNTQKPTTPTVPQIKEDEIMFLYWKQNKENKKQFDAFFVNGNTRMHIPNDTLLKECRDLVKRYKGVTEETRYSHDNWGVAAIEKTTNLVKW